MGVRVRVRVRVKVKVQAEEQGGVVWCDGTWGVQGGAGVRVRVRVNCQAAAGDGGWCEAAIGLVHCGESQG